MHENPIWPKGHIESMCPLGNTKTHGHPILPKGRIDMHANPVMVLKC